MKKFKTYNIQKKPFAAILLVFFGLIFFSCEDEDKNPLNDLSFADGGFVRFVDNNPESAIGVEQVSDLTYSFAVEDANNNVATYDLRMYADISGVRTDTVDVETVSSFPQSFSFTTSDLANLLGIDDTEIGFGDNFFFSGTATTNDGTVYSGANRLALIEIFLQTDGSYLDEDDDPVTINPTDEIVNTKEGKLFLKSGQNITDDLIDEAGYRQAYEFDFIILCPPPALLSDFIGTWQITVDPFATFVDDGIFNIVAGPEANQVTALDIFDHPNPEGGVYDVIFDFNPDTGAITVAEQPAWHCDNFGCGFGQANVEGTGFIFNCVGSGLMKLSLEHSVDAGVFGTFPMDIVKVNTP